MQIGRMLTAAALIVCSLSAITADAKPPYASTVTAGVKMADPPPTGAWTTTLGAATFALSGDTLSGTYGNNNSLFATRSGNRYLFTGLLGTNGEKCKYVRGNSDPHWAGVQLTFNSTFTHFDGYWIACRTDAQNGQPWSGDHN